MTPLEMALTIRTEHDGATESVDAFVLRKFRTVSVATLGAALELLIADERAFEDFKALLGMLQPVARKESGDPTIEALIKRKRRLGYDHKFEALLARQWRCSNCRTILTIERIEVPINNPDRFCKCTACGSEGVAPIEGVPDLKVRDGGKTGLRP